MMVLVVSRAQEAAPFKCVTWRVQVPTHKGSYCQMCNLDGRKDQNTEVAVAKYVT